MKDRMRAMNFVEIVLAMIITGIVMSLFSSVMKARSIKRDLHMSRAALYNVQNVISNLLFSRRAGGNWTLEDRPSDVCTAFTDLVNIKGNASCDDSSAGNINTAEKPNFTMLNGVSIIGMEGENWSELTGSNGRKHKYVDIFYDINSNVSGGKPNNAKGNKNTEGIDQFKIRIFKDEPIVIPLTTTTGNGKVNIFSPAMEYKNSDKNKLRYRVIKNREKQGETYVQTRKVVKSKFKDKNNKEITVNYFNYAQAACITGVADEFLKTAEKSSISNCAKIKEDAREVENDPNLCDRYFDCDIQVYDIPSSVTHNGGKSFR